MNLRLQGIATAELLLEVIVLVIHAQGFDFEGDDLVGAFCDRALRVVQHDSDVVVDMILIIDLDANLTS